ncbi:protein kinase, partial [Streptantibioticus silvisoli]
MDEYAGRVLAGRYRLPRSPADEFELVETPAFDTYSGQEVLVRQLLLPEVVPAEFDGDPDGYPDGDPDGYDGYGRAPAHADDAAERALRAARAAAALPDHPRLVQVFDVLVEDGSLWVVSELVPGARPVAAMTGFAPLTAYRAAEIAADLLAGLRALHAHGWTHRNITASTVLVCDDGRAMLDGLAFGAAQEALCGYDPVPLEVLTGAGGTDEAPAGGWAGGPDSALAGERARTARLSVVGPVTERWAPEQAATPVRGNWQLAPPIGPEADLWALGALLFRSVQGHAAFPEDNAAELAHLVCCEPAAPAEECGPLRPVVESLLRADPAERPGVEELNGWLRSLVRSAPEPDLGGAVSLPTDDPKRLPIVRRKGELV